VRLSPPQRAAVERWDQDVCVVAGPGSGKTRILIERFRWLVERKGIHPSRILAVTFTEKAATEIRTRLIEAFSASNPPVIQTGRVWVSTLHGFCTRLLKDHAVAAGIDFDFRLLDQAQTRIEQERIANCVLDELLVAQGGPFRELLSEWSGMGSDLAGALLDFFEAIRTAGVKAKDLKAPEPPGDKALRGVREVARLLLEDPVCGTPLQREAHRRMHEWARWLIQLAPDADWRQSIAALEGCPKASSLKSGTRARTLVRQLEEQGIAEAKAALALQARLPLYPLMLKALAGMHECYSQWKRDRALMDFSDLEEHAIRLLESDAELRSRIRERFDQVLMDELQDTNRLQWKLVDLIRRPGRLFAVGDINQSIYFFRHADPGVFHFYRDSLLARGDAVDEVRENYRSRPQILEAVNAIVPHLPGVEWHTLTACLEYPPKEGPSIEFLHTFRESEDQDDAMLEARWIAARIAEMAGSMRIGKPGAQRLAGYSDIAVLSRIIQSLGPVQQALDELGIPSQTSGGRSFYETREVKDLMAWLSVLANPLTEPELALVLRSPLVGISDETLLQLKMSGEPLWETIGGVHDKACHREDIRRLKWFRELIINQRSCAGAVSPEMLLAQALDESSYQAGLPPRARANIVKLMAMIRDRHAREPVTPAVLAEEMALRREEKSEAEAASGATTDCVRLMSVHAAKGLEFPIVFLAALRTGPQNKAPQFCFSKDWRLGTTWKHPGPGKKPLPDPVHLAESPARRKWEDAEEDRLLYVAMTRAEEHLVFCTSTSGSSDWAKRVCEGLGLPAGLPKEEFRGVIGSGTRLPVQVMVTAQPPPPPASRQRIPAAPPEEQILDPPEIPERQDAVIPVTAVAQFVFCPRQYYLGRYLGWPAQKNPDPDAGESEHPEWNASELGVAVHEMLAGKSVDGAPPEAHAMVRAAADSKIAWRANRASQSGREFDFLIELEDFIVRGQIDLWFEENGELVLVDYKTDQVEPGKERWHGLRYGPQLRLYALALERLLGRLPDRALLFYLRTDTLVEVELNPATMAEAGNQLRLLREAQHNNRFPLREGSHCQRCRYFGGACPARIAVPAV
jgi:ATP-dependent exoDNAse (exonuclease V) beta subunit